MTLMLHDNSDLVTEAQLAVLPAPVRLGPIHQPVPHAVLVHAMKAAATDRGFLVERAQLALNRHGRRMFGVLDLRDADSVRPDRGLSIGFRNSTDESLAIRVVAGARVFVCDNLALSGDLIALQRRNTTRLDIDAELKEAFERFLLHARALDLQIEQLQDTPISTITAKGKVFDLFAQKVLPMRLFGAVNQYYFRPGDDMTDCQPRTMWGLHNACTRALKQLPRARAFTTNVALGQAFELGAPEE